MKIIFLIGLLFTTLTYQACTKSLDFKDESSVGLKSDGNGEGYSGKPTPYDFTIANAACSEQGANGQPLPNRQIFLFPSGLAHLVRENCQDIAPKPLSSQDFSFDKSGNILYQGQTFALNASQDPFAVVAASCPTGQTPIANAVRSGMMQSSLDLLDPIWYNHGGYSLELAGSLASLPVYKMERQDPQALDRWRRISQVPLLTAGESYVYSFFARPDPTGKVMFIAYQRGAQDFEVEFDLLSGAANVTVTSGVRVIETKSQAFAGGIHFSVYFQSLVTTNSNIGIGPLGEFVGSSIYATAVQLEKLSNFCSP